MSEKIDMKTELLAPVKSARRAEQFFAMIVPALTKALPAHISVEHLIQVALTSCRKNPDLLDCTTASMMGALLECAQLGLVPDGILGHAYLVPYSNPKRKCREVQFQAGYRGLIHLAVETGYVSHIFAHCVYAADEFEYELGQFPRVSHKPALADRGEITGAYAVAVLKSGVRDVEYMSRQQIDAIRAGSRGRDQFGWTAHYGEMARKCPIRRIWKRLSISPRGQRAAVLDEMHDAGQAQQLAANVENVIDLGEATLVEPETEEPSSREMPRRKSEVSGLETINYFVSAEQVRELLELAGANGRDPLDATRLVRERLGYEKLEAIPVSALGKATELLGRPAKAGELL